MAETICASCDHPRRQHDRNGCTETKDGPCYCPYTYNDLSPQHPERRK